MESRSYHEDDIDRYLGQEMSIQEREAFEERMNHDPALQKEVALQKDITMGINLFGGESLKKQLQSVDREDTDVPPVSEEAPTRRARPMYVWLGIAASLTALFLVAILLFDRGANPQDLYATYFEPYPNVVNPAQRSEGGATDAAGQAMFFYERGEFTKAIELFTQEPLLSDQAYQFYRGVSYLGVNDAQQAVVTFTSLSEDEQNAFYEPSLWYMGLAQLQMDQPKQAKNTFQKVAAIGGDYKAEAQAILDEL
uniref:Tetratricopeptide repeat protein n=1 Tax=Roseihalotalea indica TaxID=2867963 RepID=A0AA49JE86_9BACT|nr:tetratricopeptide repeat protein [Tunicatimonas sp. TK19036]